MTSLDEYTALREGAVIGAIADRRQIAVSGPDRAAFLQGLLTNDIPSLTSGRGCYAAWLTPQGRMLTDLHVLESGDMILLDVPAGEAEQAAERLEQFHFTEDVQIASLAEALRAVWLHGPGAPQILEALAGREGSSYAAWTDYRNARVEIAGAPVVIARIDQLGVPGYAIYADVQQGAAVTAALAAAGVRPATPATLEAARIEAGYPIFGIDMTTDTIPLEAGIEDRAISLTKGCYVGQEVIIRVLHRGHGRVARKLVLLRIDGAVPQPGAKIVAGDREIGFVTSAAKSPRLGAIALGYVHRDFLEPGTAVDIDAGAERLRAVVTPRSTS
jgi:folate-binding protein YgfZ